MYRDPIEKLFKPADNIKLTAQKKEAIHQEVLSFMKKNPFVGQVPQKTWNWLDFPMFAFDNVRFAKSQMVLSGFLLFFLVGGITTVSANSALPGELLYPIKLGVNENIKQVLAFSDEAKLNVGVELAKVRLQEYEQLTLQGKLTTDNEAKVNSNFKNHSDKVSKYISKLNKTEDAGNVGNIATNFEASLRAHKIIINGLQKNANARAVSPILDSIENATSKMSDINANLNNGDSSDKEKHIQEKIRKIETSINKVKKSLKDKGAKIGTDAVLQSEGNLNLVQQKIDEGKLQESISSLQEASIIAEQSQYLIDAKNKLGIDIPINIPLNINEEKKGSDIDAKIDIKNEIKIGL